MARLELKSETPSSQRCGISQPLMRNHAGKFLVVVIHFLKGE